MALDQCRRLLARMPRATAIAAATTGDAAHEVAEGGDPSEAAIASDRAAAMYGLNVIASDIGDHPEAYTRFVAVAPYTRLDREAESWRTAFSFVTDHAPGALHRTIERDLTSDEIATVKAWLVAAAQRLERATESRAA